MKGDVDRGIIRTAKNGEAHLVKTRAFGDQVSHRCFLGKKRLRSIRDTSLSRGSFHLTTHFHVPKSWAVQTQGLGWELFA